MRMYVDLKTSFPRTVTNRDTPCFLVASSVGRSGRLLTNSSASVATKLGVPVTENNGRFGKWSGALGQLINMIKWVMGDVQSAFGARGSAFCFSQSSQAHIPPHMKPWRNLIGSKTSTPSSHTLITVLHTPMASLPLPLAMTGRYPQATCACAYDALSQRVFRGVTWPEMVLRHLRSRFY